MSSSPIEVWGDVIVEPNSTGGGTVWCYSVPTGPNLLEVDYTGDLKLVMAMGTHNGQPTFYLEQTTGPGSPSLCKRAYKFSVTAITAVASPLLGQSPTAWPALAAANSNPLLPTITFQTGSSGQGGYAWFNESGQAGVNSTVLDPDKYLVLQLGPNCKPDGSFGFWIGETEFDTTPECCRCWCPCP